MSKALPLTLTVALFVTATSGCAMVDPFKRSDEAMMAKVADEIPLGNELGDWLEKASDKKIVLVNMENDRYQDDQLPEYMIHDALYSRLTGEKSRAPMLLDRDPDLLSLMARERDGLDLPSHMEGGDGPADSLTFEQRRAEIGGLIAHVVNEIAEQDVLVTHEASCCGDGKNHTQAAHENLIANEVGTQKAQLLRDLVGQFSSLYPRVKAAEVATRHVDLTTADYLFAYRVYDYGTWNFEEERITYLKLHIRVIDLDSGEIVVSDFMEHRIEDSLTSKERKTLLKSKASQSDYGRPASRTPKNGR